MGFENGRLLRVTLRASLANEQHVNTFHYDLQDATYPLHDNDPQSLADLFRDNVIPKFRACYNNTWSIGPVVIIEEKDPQNPDAPRQEWTSGAALAGTNVTGGDRLPHALVGVATHKTAHIGRRATGRCFIGGTWTEDNQTAGSWAGGTVTTMQQYLDSIPRSPDLTVGVSSATADWVVYSRTSRAQDVDPYASKITSSTVHPECHYLRSRQPF
jgi:hypothetical protein